MMDGWVIDNSDRHYLSGSAAIASRKRYFEALMVGLLCSCANLGLVNQRIGIGNGNGQNLIGPRDVCLGILVMMPFATKFKLRDYPELRRGIAKICLVGFVTASVSLLVGALMGRNLFWMLAEYVPFIAWLLPFSMVINVKTEDALIRLWDWICVIGVLEAAGAIGELMFQTPLVTGTEVTNGGDTIIFRSTPSGWPLIVLASGGLLVNILIVRNAHLFRRVGSCLGLLILITGALLTQSRTVLVGIWVVFGAIVLFGKIRARRRIGILLVIASTPLWILMATYAGDYMFGEGYSTGFMERYSVIFSAEKGIDYAEKDGRTQEVESALETWNQWIVTGVGLGGHYNANNQPTGEQSESAGQMTHNTLLYFSTRFGIIGIILVLFMFITTLGAAAGALRMGEKCGGVACAVGAGVFGVSTCMMFAGIPVGSYTAPIITCAWGILTIIRNHTRAKQEFSR